MDTQDSYSANLPARSSRPEPPALAAARPPAEEASRPLNVRMILRGLTRYWWQMLAAWLVIAAALDCLIYLKVKPSYEAVALLEAKPSEAAIYAASNNSEMGVFLETQVNLIKSTNILNAAQWDPRALPHLRAQLDPVQHLRSTMEVASRGGTHLIQIATRAADPAEAADLVNSVAGAYIKANDLKAFAATKNRMTKLEEELRRLDKLETQLADDWRELANKHAIAQIPTLYAPTEKGEKPADGEPKGVRSVTTREYEEAMAQLRKVKGELFEAEILVGHLESLPQAVEDPRALREQHVRRSLQNDPDIARVKGQIGDAEGRLANLNRTARNAPNDPAARNLKGKLAGLDDDLARLMKTKEEYYRSTFVYNRVASQDPRREALKKIEIAKDTRRRLEEEIKQIDILSRKEAGGAVDIYLKQQELADVKAMKQQVVHRIDQLKFDATTEAKIIVVDDAVAPARPSSNSRPKLLLATPFGVLAALMSLVILLEIRAGRVGHPDELSPRMRAEVFAVPPLPTLTSQNARGRGDQVEEFTQRVDHLRVALCGETGNGVARCVLITSAAGGEGKTTLAAQLAGRCASAGLSTLLIDADLRRPRLGQLLDVPEGPGLADVLSGDAEVESALVVIGSAGGFHLLPAGTPSPDPSRLLRSRRLGELIGHLRQGFDIVILDTPPVLPVPDALTLGDWVDGAVLATRSDASRVSLVERAGRMLSAKGIPLLGVVVNGVRTSDMGYGGYSGYMGYAATAAAEDAFDPSAATANMPAPEI